jgi:hypothetical protein
MLFASGVAVTHRALAGVDLVIIGIYFAIVFGIGFYFSRKERTSEDYFLASRNIGGFAIGASLFVSNISTEHFIGLAGSGATSGLAAGNFEWEASLILLLLGWVFVPFYLRSNIFTMPEFLERRFNRNCATYLASISIIAYIFTKSSVHLYAVAIVLERVVGWNQWTAAIILVVATGIYTVAGGLAAYWRLRSGPLQRIAKVYVPFFLYRVQYEIGRATQTRFFAIDAVDGSLDLFEFPRVPGDAELLALETRNSMPPALPATHAEELLRDKVLRVVFQQGFFKLRKPQLEAIRQPIDLHLPYWLAFYGKESVRCRVMDAVRRRIEGAKASAFFEEWLAA